MMLKQTFWKEYNSIAFKSKNFLEWNEFPLYSEPLPRNGSLNTLLNLNEKAYSKLFTKMKDSNEHVLDIIVEKGKENTEIEIETISLGGSFMTHPPNVVIHVLSTFCSIHYAKCFVAMKNIKWVLKILTCVESVKTRQTQLNPCSLIVKFLKNYDLK